MSIKKRAQWLKKKMIRELKYGTMDETNKKKIMEKTASKLRNSMTSPEVKMSDLLTKMKIEFVSQKIIDDVIYDFYIPSKRLLIEVDGDYYHGNPEVYEEGDLNHMQKKNKKNDKYKDALAKAFGYNLERFWEKDINKNIEEVKNKIKSYDNK